METSLNLPLSGTEVKKAIVDVITEALASDSRLSGHYAFRAFSFTANLNISLPGAVEDTIHRELAKTVGELGCSPEIVTVTAEMPELPVDEVRVETGQPVIVSSIAPDGRAQEREVHYARPAKKRTAKVAEAKA